MWYAMQVFTGEEESVKRLISEMVDDKVIAECFIIRFEKSRRYRGEWHREGNILFPGYVFIETDCPLDAYEKLKKVPKLSKILGRDAEYFEPINEREEMALKELMGFNHTIEMSVGYIEGERIIVTSGALVDKEGMIKKIDRHKRTAVISIEMFGQMTDTTVGLEIISKTE